MAMATKASSSVEVSRVYKKVRQHRDAEHVVAIYKYRGGAGFQDDGEYSAGRRLFKVYSSTQSPNVAVFLDITVASIWDQRDTKPLRNV